MIKFKKKSCVKLSTLILVIISMCLTSASTSWSKVEHQKDPKIKTIRQKPNRTNLKWDIKVKESVYKKQLEMLKQSNIPIDNDKQMVARLNKILDNLKTNALIPDLPYEVHLVDHKTVNAVCYPGGGILFFKGIFDSKEGMINPKDNDEIAAVMGHEMAHATLRHAYKKQQKANTIGFLGSVASVAVGAGAGADASDLFDLAYNVGTGLYFPSYSRKQESEADLEGLFTLIGTGYNPDKTISLWERAATKSKSSDKTSVFSSHPADGKRAEDLKIHLNNIKQQKTS